MQSIWKGSITFGLVSIRVQLFAATEERGIAFHQVHARDGGRIRYRRVCEADGAEVDFAEIARGYQMANGEVVVLTDDDFAELPLPTGRAINVLSFVEAQTVDPIRISRSYYCEPVGTDTRPYRLLCAALERTAKVAMVKVALRGRESVALLRPHEQVLVLQLLLWPDEVRRPRFAFLDDELPLPPQEVTMVESYIQTLTGAVDPEETVDRYRLALEQLVEAKVTGLAVEQPPRPVEPVTEGVDLMEALRRSVEEARRSRAGNGDRRRTKALATPTAERPVTGQPRPPAAKAGTKAAPKKATAKATGKKAPAAPTRAAARTPAGNAAARTTAGPAAPAKGVPVKGAPAKAAPTKATATKAAPTTAAPTRATPTKAAPTKATATKAASAKAAATKAVAPKGAPTKAAVKAAGTKAAGVAGKAAPAKAGRGVAGKAPAKAAGNRTTSKVGRRNATHSSTP